MIRQFFTKLRQLLQNFFKGTNPHFMIVHEIGRTTSPNKKYDAVLAKANGSNLKLFIVKTGKLTYEVDHLAAFIHCLDENLATIEWLDEKMIKVNVKCEDISTGQVKISEHDACSVVLILP